jgi:hypothetical protein
MSSAEREISPDSYAVVSPEGEVMDAPGATGQSLGSLNGKTICQVWDYRFRGDEIFALIRDELKARYPDIKFVDYSAFGNVHGALETEIMAKLPDLFRQHGCDGVVSGMGA